MTSGAGSFSLTEQSLGPYSRRDRTTEGRTGSLFDGKQEDDHLAGNFALPAGTGTRQGQGGIYLSHTVLLSTVPRKILDRRETGSAPPNHKQR